MRKINFFILLLLAVSLSYGQSPRKTLKTGTMDYCAGTDFCGKATYQYYEDTATASEIKHGFFKASGLSKSDFGYSSFSITGQFIDGFRNGLWTFTMQRKDLPIEGGSYSTGKLKSTQNFKNGLPNGKWRLHEIWKARYLLEIHGKSVWGLFCEPLVDSASTTFKNGMAFGATYTKKYGDETKATLNDNGFIIGNFIAPWGISTFNSNGVKTKWEGEYLDLTVIQNADLYLTGKITKSKLDELSIRVDTVINAFENMPAMFEQEFFEGVGGDKSNIATKNTRIYGRYFKFSR